MGMKYRDPSTGQFKDLKVKTSDTLPIGTQVAYGGTVPPTGWLICDGSAVSRTTYAELFKVIGTSYGAGDGSTTFNLPNKKGRLSAGYDSTNSKFNAIGKHLGEETHTLTVAELPKDFPKLQKSIAYDSGSTEAGFSAGEVKNYSSNEYKLKLSQNVFTSTGNGEPHNNIQPTEVDNWIIKAFQSIGVVGKVVNTKTNSDNDTYSCNYINKIGKSLWRGTFDSGSIEVVGISKYTIIGVYTSDSVLCIGTKSYGSGGFLEYGSSSNISFNAYRFNTSGDTLTIDTNNTGATNGNQHIQVTEIYGIF